jgi:hypothetical protein
MELPSHISSNTVLTAAAGSYTGNPTVDSGVLVTVEAGAEFHVGGMTVDGTLNIEGTSEEPVIFSQEGFWGGLTFRSGSGASVLDHVEVIRGPGSGQGSINIESASPTIVHSTIRESHEYGIRVNGGAPEIAHDRIIDSTGAGAYFGLESPATSGEVNFHDNVVEGSGSSFAVGVEAGGGLIGGTFSGNTIKNNTSLQAVDYNGGSKGTVPADIFDNTIEENYSDRVALSGKLGGSGNWTAHGFPIVPTGELTIPKGVSVTLGPGIVFEAPNGGTLKVEGTLKAEGEADDPVRFTGMEGSHPGPIIFTSSSTESLLDHAEIFNGGSEYSGGAVEVLNSSPTITHSILFSSTGYGILIKGGSPDIENNKVRFSSNSGIYYEGLEEGKAGGDINIHDNRLDHNGGSGAIAAIVSTGITSTSLGGNTLIENSSTEAIGFTGYGESEVPPDLGNNTLIANHGNDIGVSGTLRQSGAWSNPGGPIAVSSLRIASGATLTVEPGLTFQGGSLTIDGALKAEGTNEEPVVFAPQGESKWGGLTFATGSSESTLDHVEVVRGGFSSGTAITIEGASPTITHSTIRESSYIGVEVQSGSPTIEWNRFRKNPYGLYYGGEGSLAAPNNDWNCASGPAPMGCGDTVSSGVEWKPDAELAEQSHPCLAESSNPGPNLDCLLYRYSPVLKLSSQEPYYPDSAEEIVENWGDETGRWHQGGVAPYRNQLVDEYSAASPIAESGPDFGKYDFRLTLEALGTGPYPNEETPDEDDWIDEVGENYEEDAHALEAQGYKNHAYGRLVEDESGKIWLQYWYFYYYNSFSVLGAGAHEGDWESVEIGLDEELKPELVVLSEHAEAAVCKVGEFEENEQGSPIVYVAIGSHANYPEAGAYITTLATTTTDDFAYGEGESVQPSIQDISKNVPGWVEWPGRWGHSSGIDESPKGPALHSEWESPTGYAEDAHSCKATYDENPYEPGFERNSRADLAPSIAVVGSVGQHPKLRYQLPRSKTKPKALLVSVNGISDGLPPSTTVIHDLAQDGEITLPFEVDPSERSVVLASLFYGGGHLSRVVRQPLKPVRTTKSTKP